MRSYDEGHFPTLNVTDFSNDVLRSAPTYHVIECSVLNNANLVARTDDDLGYGNTTRACRRVNHRSHARLSDEAADEPENDAREGDDREQHHLNIVVPEERSEAPIDSDII